MRKLTNPWAGARRINGSAPPRPACNAAAPEDADALLVAFERLDLLVTSPDGTASRPWVRVIEDPLSGCVLAVDLVARR